MICLIVVKKYQNSQKGFDEKCMYSSISMKRREFDKKLPVGFEPGTLRFQILYLTPRLLGKMQRCGDNYDMNRVLKSALFRKEEIDALKST